MSIIIMSGTNFVFFTKSDLILHAALPKSSMVDSDDDTLRMYLNENAYVSWRMI